MFPVIPNFSFLYAAAVIRWLRSRNIERLWESSSDRSHRNQCLLICGDVEVWKQCGGPATEVQDRFAEKHRHDKEPEKPKKGFGSTSSGGDGLSRIGALGGNPTLQISPMKLDGNNYLSWSRVCLLSIDAAGLYDYVTGTLKEPTSTDPIL
ncbi:hypothetical protein F0562_003288 [Nyssa sinensis]|uniref:Retrotransposon Copia-like N-terminal domain-containing protein n=1 Tax=Nyssa sinensis TaxID=561372 RepID=A0A5J5BV35_9ASTE|nr:hypothetical protein F0562_003288 [Nyssa sinensis]